MRLTRDLSQTEVEKIRKLHSQGIETRILRERFGVSRTHLKTILFKGLKCENQLLVSPESTTGTHGQQSAL